MPGAASGDPGATRGKEYQDHTWPYIYEFTCDDCAFWYTNTVSSKTPVQEAWADFVIDGWLSAPRDSNPQPSV